MAVFLGYEYYDQGLGSNIQSYVEVEVVVEIEIEVGVGIFSETSPLVTLVCEFRQCSSKTDSIYVLAMTGSPSALVKLVP